MTLLFVSSEQDLNLVDAGGEDQVVGVTKFYKIYCLNASNASSIKEAFVWNWNTLQGELMYFSWGLTACWGVNTHHQTYLTIKSCLSAFVVAPDLSVDGQLVSVFVFFNRKPHQTPAAQLGRTIQSSACRSWTSWKHLGISEKVALVTGWSQIEFCVPIKHMSYDLGRQRLLTEADVILEYTKFLKLYKWNFKTGV